MSKKNGLDMLQQEVEIPEIVQQRAQDAFDQIHREAKLADKGIVRISEARREEQTMKKKGRKTKRTFAVAALTAILVLGTMTVAVAAFRGSLTEGFKNMFHLSEKQEEDLLNREDGLLHIIETESPETESGNEKEEMTEEVHTTSSKEEVELESNENGLRLSEGDVTSATDNGITVTLSQAMVDGYHLIVSLRVEGLPEDNAESILFAERKMRFIGEERFGSVVTNAYYYGDGVGEWVFSARPRNKADAEPGWFFGKQLSIHLKDLNMFIGKEEGHTKVLEGEWDLCWTVHGTEETTVFEVNEKLGNTGATVTNVIITPITMETHYDFPKTEVKEGNLSEYKDPPVLRGVILKDGTVYVPVTFRELERYAPGSDSEYIVTGQASYILDPNEIESLLYVEYGKNVLDENNQILDHVYVIPLHE